MPTTNTGGAEPLEVSAILEAPVLEALDGYEKGRVVQIAFEGIDGVGDLWPSVEVVGACPAFVVEVKGRRRYDYRRSASLYVLRFEGRVAAVASCAGREEDESVHLRIVDLETARRMVAAAVALGIVRDFKPAQELMGGLLPAPQWGDDPARLGRDEWEATGA